MYVFIFTYIFYEDVCKHRCLRNGGGLKILCSAFLYTIIVLFTTTCLFVHSIIRYCSELFLCICTVYTVQSCGAVVCKELYMEKYNFMLNCTLLILYQKLRKGSLG